MKTHRNLRVCDGCLIFAWAQQWEMKSLLLWYIFVQCAQFRGPSSLHSSNSAHEIVAARKNRSKNLWSIIISEVTASQCIWVLSQNRLWRAHEKVRWNCAHCTRPSTLRSSNSTHEIVAARKIGQQNSGQSSFWSDRIAMHMCSITIPQNSGQSSILKS